MKKHSMFFFHFATPFLSKTIIILCALTILMSTSEAFTLILSMPYLLSCHYVPNIAHICLFLLFSNIFEIHDGCSN